MKILVAIAFALVALVGTPAHAQMAMLDRQTAGSDAGVTFDYLFVDHDKLRGVNGFRFDFFGQFVEPSLGIGGYVALPVTHGSFDASVGPFQINGSGTGVGDLEVGGIYRLRSPRRDAQFILHAGLALPTGSSGDDSAQANTLGIAARATDVVTTLPSATTLRVGFSPIWRRGMLIARMDVGVDLNLSIADGRNTLPPVLRLNGGIGYRGEGFALMAELTNTFITGDESDGGNKTLNEAGIEARFFLGEGISAHAALVLPLDDDLNSVVAVINVGLAGHF